MCNGYLSLCRFIVGDAGSSICISLFSTLVAVRDLLLLDFLTETLTKVSAVSYKLSKLEL